MKARGIKKGDRITIYMPMVPGGGLCHAGLRAASARSIRWCSADSRPRRLAGRIIGCDSNCVITADEGIRGARTIPLKANTDKALEQCPMVETVFVTKRTGADIGWSEGRDVWMHEACAAASDDCPAEEMNAEDPLFILFHLGLDRQAEGRGAHHRRLSRSMPP